MTELLSTASPVQQRGRWRRLRAPLLTATGVGLASFALRLRDPHRSGSWGLCPWKALTGMDCPGCGGLRAVNDLTHGHLGQAFSSNALFVLCIPLIVALWVLAVRRAWRGDGPRFTQRQIVTSTWVIAVVGIGFAVVRNTPWGHALHS